MFDIGFSELMVIAVVALIVIGPERLPKVARTLGHLFGRMQRYVNDVKADITREMQLEELRKLQSEMEQAARAIETNVRQEMNSTEDELNKIAREASVDAAATPATPAPTPAPEAASSSIAAPAGHSAAVPPSASSEPSPQHGTEQLPLDLQAGPPAVPGEHKPG